MSFIIGGNPFGNNNNNGGGNIPDASTGSKGLVQLSNAIDSDNSSLAATSKAVKDALQVSINTIEQTIKENERYVVFVIRDKVTIGTHDTHGIVPFNSKLKNISFSIIQPSTQDISFNLMKRVNDQWSNLIQSDLTITADTTYKEFTITDSIELNKGDIIALDIKATIEDGNNATINVALEK